MKEQITQRIKSGKVIAVAAGIYGESCIKLAMALRDGGIELLELALNADNHPQVWSTIQQLHCELGDTMSVGIGNVLSIDDVKYAKDAGSAFVSSPITDTEVIHIANDLDLVTIPGALTPTEIVFAHRCGADFVKVYPAGTMGPAYFNHIQTVIKDIPVLASSGITRSNVRLYENSGVIGIFADDCLFTKEMVKKEAWVQIADTTRAFINTL